MIIKITSCQKYSYWYKDKIGQTFEIDYSVDDVWRVWHEGSSISVLKCDCEILN